MSQHPHRCRAFAALRTVPRNALRRDALRVALLAVPLACAPRGTPARSPAPGDVARAGPAAQRSTRRPEARDTSSVAIGDGKTLERLFVGRFPGVTVTPSTGGGLQIRIRGGSNSFLASDEPLYIVDGTPLSQGSGGIVFLNPYDIEKIEVLKNTADTSLYGVRGANGVIRITTTRSGRR